MSPTSALAAIAAGGAAILVAPAALMRAATAGDRHPVEHPAFRRAEAALVLGARVWPDGRPSRFLRERVSVGVALYRAGVVERLLMSGAGQDSSGHGEPAVMRDVAIALGVPAAHIIEDPHGFNTEASAVNAAALGLTSVIACSQEFHLPRAVWLCRRSGLDAQGAHPPVLARKHTAIGYGRELAACWKAVLPGT